MFELGWIELMPKIPLYESFNRPLTYEAQPTREVKNLPPPSCHRKMLDSFAAKMPGRLRAHARLKRGVRDALVASQTNRFDVAHRLWRQTLRDANDSKVPFIATLEASVGKEPSALEALVASRDFKSMNEVAFLLPEGSYAGGRVINAATWFGGARGGVAHGAVVGCRQGGFQGQCVEGQRDGLWTLEGTYPRGHFQVHYTPDDPVGSATYVCKDHYDGTTRIEGAWTGVGVDALPQKATCTWEGRRQRFAGTVNAERDTFWQSYVGNKFGLLSDAQGRVDEKEGSGLSFDGDISNHIAFMGGSVVDACGTLRLPASMQAHRGSPEVSEGCVTGVWKNNKLVQGEGEFTMKDGTRYKGSLGPEGLMHGQGTLYWTGGATYQGMFDGGCLQDQGTLTWPGSEQLSGRFFRTPTWQQGGHRATCDVSLGHNAGVRFSFDATGQPDASTLIKLGA